MFVINELAMTASAKRQQLMIYLADVPDKKVNALYTLLEDDIKPASFVLTNEHLQILEERRNDYLSVKSKPVPWKEAIDRIKNERKCS